MEWTEAVTGLGAVGITAIALVVVGRVLLKIADTLLNKTSDTPALSSAIQALAESNTKQAESSDAERKAWNQLITTIATEMRDLRITHDKHEAEEARREAQEMTRHEAILVGFQEAVKTLNKNQSDIRQLTTTIDKLETTMTEHTAAKPDIADLIKAIEELGKKIDKVDRNVIEIKQEFGEIKVQTARVVKEATQETPTVPAPDDQKAVSKTAAQRAVEEVKNEVIAKEDVQGRERPP